LLLLLAYPQVLLLPVGGLARLGSAFACGESFLRKFGFWFLLLRNSTESLKEKQQNASTFVQFRSVELLSFTSSPTYTQYPKAPQSQTMAGE
jgi:hypothetical protein